MSDENINISLNVASEPVWSQKVKRNAGSVQVFQKSAHGSSNASLQGIKEKKAVPKSIMKQKPSSLSTSIWKQFKKVNKTHGKTIGPHFKKRVLDTKVVQKSQKTVSFDESNAQSDLEVSNDGDDDDAGSAVEHLETPKGKKKKILSFDECQFNVEKKNSQFKNKLGHLPGKETSLFEDNPEIPNVAHKSVKPLKEPMFSDMCFSDTSLHPFMIKHLNESMGLTKMTKVQEKSIPVLLKKKDMLIRSQTGSGKTLAFALPILHDLQQIRPKIKRTDGVMALIVVPTRELALQTYEVFNKLVKSYTWIVPGYLAGGEKRKSEKARLRKGISILIGTPGRLMDHLRTTRCLSLDRVSWLVLDEADRLFDLGYEKDVSQIIATLDKGKTSLLNPEYMNPDSERVSPRERNTVLLSATLTAKVMELAGLSMRDPVFIDACDESKSKIKPVPIFTVDEGNVSEMVAIPENLVQQYVVVPAKLRLIVLSAFILWKCKLTEEKKMLIFTATQDMVDYYAELLSTALSNGNDDGNEDSEPGTFPSTSGIDFLKLHGSMNQKERTDVFNSFRKSHSGVLFCTDVAARGLDLPEVDWVIQYTGPASVPDYVHRVGRTARGGHTGSSIMFLLPSEVKFIDHLEDHRIRLTEEKMDRCLGKLRKFYPGASSAEEAASELQSTIESVVSEQAKMHDSGCRAFSSWCRFYACYPRQMKKIFSIRDVHQGHYAKSFALRDPPSAIMKRAKEARKEGKTSFASERSREREKIQVRDAGSAAEGKRKAAVSEFDSGLEPLRKKRK